MDICYTVAGPGGPASYLFLCLLAIISSNTKMRPLPQECKNKPEKKIREPDLLSEFWKCW